MSLVRWAVTSPNHLPEKLITMSNEQNATMDQTPEWQKKQKDPCVLFYTSDFYYGVAFMNYEQRGKYITLLCLQHQHGHLAEEEMLIVCGTYDKKIFSKFLIDADGKYYNYRLDLEIQRRKKHSDKQRENAKKRWDNIPNDNNGICIGNAMASATAMPLETEIEICNNIEDKKRVKSCLMKNSGITIDDIKERFLKTKDLKNADPEHYFNSALDWSDSRGMKRDDWIATVSNFARRDIREDKLKIIHKPLYKPL
jgi:uncharacterized protein YdaU (DUF1376 family)